MAFYNPAEEVDPKCFHPLENTSDLDPLLERIGDAHYVFLGEASHGTHEYYTWRARISKRLIEEKGFSFIAVEGDWPDCYKINEWVKGYINQDRKIEDILKEFDRWPTWMWANWEIAALATWLRDHNHNHNLPKQKRVGFYGLDIYSLWESIEIIINYLEKEDPKTAKIAKEALACLEPYKERQFTSVFSSARPGCEKEVVKLLRTVREKASQYDSHEEAGLNAELNTLVMANAEKYYKATSGFGDDSWNIRDRHMMESLNTLMKHHGPEAKVIVWGHNTHIGDARATDMALGDLINIGQLAREQHSRDEVVLVGFGSYKGSVIAGRSWGAPMQEMELPEAIAGSLEYNLHQVEPADKLLIFEEEDLFEAFEEKMGHRAVGVVYDPAYERGNYVPSRVSERYDAFVFIDETRGLHPLKIKPNWDLLPETYPFGI
ncbi:erythromycin esterase family protein [Salegentibacter chungangensis]|uniref:Erythromycin esterase family protein n=1 Tax=Salegentibacter chungangensis TaxID=1335724 RepID=A0ABW3NRM3_9FLAO